MAIQHHYNDAQSDDLIIHVHPELRKRIGLAAAQSDLSVEDYVGRILEQAVPDEKKSTEKPTGRLNRAAVDELLRFREELKHAHPGQVFEDSVEVLRQIREERMRELEQRYRIRSQFLSACFV